MLFQTMTATEATAEIAAEAAAEAGATHPSPRPGALLWPVVQGNTSHNCLCNGLSAKAPRVQATAAQLLGEALGLLRSEGLTQMAGAPGLLAGVLLAVAMQQEVLTARRSWQKIRISGQGARPVWPGYKGRTEVQLPLHKNPALTCQRTPHTLPSLKQDRHRQKICPWRPCQLPLQI